jgi:predicted lipid carrier protein YhbT
MHILIRSLLPPLRLIPDRLHTEVLARVFNHFLRGQPIAKRLLALNGKTAAIHITDIKSEFFFVLSGECIAPANHHRADVVIRGALSDFWLLATGHEDPDTLFFNRRLCIEGDTETGVHIKNLIDAIDFDWEAHFNSVLPAPAADAAVRGYHFLRRVFQDKRFLS